MAALAGLLLATTAEMALGAIAIAGAALLVVWAAFRIRGRNLIPAGPAPAARFGLDEAIFILLGSIFLQIVVGQAARTAGYTGVGVVLVAEGLELALLLGVVLLYAQRRAPPAPGHRGRAAVAGALACVAALPLIAASIHGWQFVLDEIGVPWREQAIRSEMKAAGAWPYILLAVFFAPVTEEIVFRGALYLGVKRVAGTVVAAIGSSAVFAIIHGAMFAPPIFLLALLLVYVYERTGSLLAPIAFHAVFNGFTVANDLFGGGA